MVEWSIKRGLYLLETYLENIIERGKKFDVKTKDTFGKYCDFLIKRADDAGFPKASKTLKTFKYKTLSKDKITKGELAYFLRIKREIENE